MVGLGAASGSIGVKEDIDLYHPELAEVGYKITSEENISYNCIAWAAGDNTQWWECYEHGPVNSPGYYWPPGAKFGDSTEALVSAYETLGYWVCQNSDFEQGYEKVALYALDGEWKHAARQLPEGSWTSKLGEWEDVRHERPEDASGSIYGNVFCIMKRAIK